jgi:hypothetical protein
MQQQTIADQTLARKAMLLVRRDQLKKLFAQEQAGYEQELKAQGKSIIKPRL